MKYDVIVIGAGLSGLSAAAHLARAGKKVLVVDQRAMVGGATVTEELIPGFRFNSVTDDFGWLAPQTITDLGLQSHGLQVLEPESTVTSLLGDGRHFTLYRDLQQTIASIREHCEADGEKYAAFSAQMSKLAGFLSTLYMTPALRPLAAGGRDLFDMARVGRRLRGLGRADMMDLLRVLPLSVNELLDDNFACDALKVTIGAGGIQGLHQGPRSAGTTYVMLHHHIGRDAGAFRMRQRARGGVGAVADAFAKAARAAGAEIRLEAGVSRIITKNWAAHGVVLTNGEEIEGTAVLSSAAPGHTLIDLVDVAQLDPEFVHEVGNVRSRGVTARVHFALSGLPKLAGLSDEALRGVLSFAPSLTYIEKAYDAIKYGEMSEQPYLEATIPSLTDATLAPAGQHVMSVNVQYAPYQLRNGTWDEGRRSALGDVVVKTLEEHAPGFSSLILDRRVLTPLDLEQQYALPEGSLDYAEIALDQVLFMRPVPECARYQTPIKNLFVCGAGTHPGRSIAGTSGQLAARAILSA